MKIKIITIHALNNFGSVFQAYALQKYLQNLGNDVEIIDYNPPYFKPKSLRSRLGAIINYKSYKTRIKKFAKFINNNMNLTKQSYYSPKDFIKYPLKADLFIAGGDQLWNTFHPCGNDDVYKLTFTNGCKISYATSMGQTGFTDEQLIDLAAKIKGFSNVSVRESSSVQLLKNKGIVATHCVDPVFLLNPGDYKKFIIPVNQPKYMMVYLVTPSEMLERCIEYLSHKYGLKVILCSGFSKKCTCDEFLKDLGPDEILSYLKNAKIVLSSSFHATSFSMIFKKQFFTILPDSHTNERIVDILTIRGLKNRIITEKTDINQLDGVINYDIIPNYDHCISESKEYLRRALIDNITLGN